MDIQALEILSNLAAITTKQGSGDAEVVSGDFSRLLTDFTFNLTRRLQLCRELQITVSYFRVCLGHQG